MKKILTGTLALAALFTLGATVHAEEPNIKNEIREMRKSGDFSKMRQRFQNHTKISDEQRAELKELREAGDKDAVREKMKEFGITNQRGIGHGLLKDLSDEQRAELRDLHKEGDKDAVRKKMKEFGVEFQADQKMEKLEDILSDDDFKELKDVQEDIKEAHEKIKTIYEDNKDKIEEAGIKGFFHRVGGFFRGLFK